jgi:hypothetical protein
MKEPGVWAGQGAERLGRTFALDLDPKELSDEHHATLDHTLASRDLAMDVAEIAGAGNRIFSHRSRKRQLLWAKRCNPFPDGCQREGLTQSRIPGTNVSGIAKTYQA